MDDSVKSKYNLNNPSIKRILKEVKELEEEKSTEYVASPLEENIFEWHFTVRGPASTAFAGGLFHGRILLPAEYPFKPPNIVLLTPNGRFETGKKICLSITGHHPEYWQPGWTIRTILLALIAFLPSQGQGAIGSLDYSDEERRLFAKKSLDWQCSSCGVTNKKLLPMEDQSVTAQHPPKELDGLDFSFGYRECNKTEADPRTSLNEATQKEANLQMQPTSPPNKEAEKTDTFDSTAKNGQGSFSLSTNTSKILPANGFDGSCISHSNVGIDNNESSCIERDLVSTNEALMRDQGLMINDSVESSALKGKMPLVSNNSLPTESAPSSAVKAVKHQTVEEDKSAEKNLEKVLAIDREMSCSEKQTDVSSDAEQQVANDLPSVQCQNTGQSSSSSTSVAATLKANITSQPHSSSEREHTEIRTLPAMSSDIANEITTINRWLYLLMVIIISLLVHKLFK